MQNIKTLWSRDTSHNLKEDKILTREIGRKFCETHSFSRINYYPLKLPRTQMPASLAKQNELVVNPVENIVDAKHHWKQNTWCSVNVVRYFRFVFDAPVTGDCPIIHYHLIWFRSTINHFKVVTCHIWNSTFFSVFSPGRVSLWLNGFIRWGYSCRQRDIIALKWNKNNYVNSESEEWSSQLIFQFK